MCCSYEYYQANHLYPCTIYFNNSHECAWKLTNEILDIANKQPNSSVSNEFKQNGTVNALRTQYTLRHICVCTESTLPFCMNFIFEKYTNSNCCYTFNSALSMVCSCFGRCHLRFHRHQLYDIQNRNKKTLCSMCGVCALHVLAFETQKTIFSLLD